jgi:hypothetical protein
MEIKSFINEKMCRMSAKIHLSLSSPTANHYASSHHHTVLGSEWERQPDASDGQRMV